MTIFWLAFFIVVEEVAGLPLRWLAGELTFRFLNSILP